MKLILLLCQDGWGRVHMADKIGYFFDKGPPYHQSSKVLSFIFVAASYGERAPEMSLCMEAQNLGVLLNSIEYRPRSTLHWV